MPHFIIECSENIIGVQSPELIMQAVYDAAETTGLFAQNDIKVRLQPYRYFKLGENKKDFIHVFGNIMEGRSAEQKADLSKKIVESLNPLFPGISFLSVNIAEFEKLTYCNKALIDPQNVNGNRHYNL